MRDTPAFLIARDTMCQTQWLAAIAELEAVGLGEMPVPSNVPQAREVRQASYRFWNCSGGTVSSQGRWASGVARDGRGAFECLADPKPLTDDAGALGQTDPRLGATPVPPAAAE